MGRNSSGWYHFWRHLFVPCIKAGLSWRLNSDDHNRNVVVISRFWFILFLVALWKCLSVSKAFLFAERSVGKICLKPCIVMLAHDAVSIFDFCCLAGFVFERAGHCDIGLEGKILGVLFCSGGSGGFGSLWVGCVLVLLASVSLAMGSRLCICIYTPRRSYSFRCSVNTIVAGLNVTLSWIGRVWWFKHRRCLGGSRFLSILTFAMLWWCAVWLSDLFRTTQRHNILFILAFAMVPVDYWAIYKHVFGYVFALWWKPTCVNMRVFRWPSFRFRALLFVASCVVCGASLSIGSLMRFLETWAQVKVICAGGAEFSVMASVRVCLLFAVAFLRRRFIYVCKGCDPAGKYRSGHRSITLCYSFHCYGGFIGKSRGPKHRRPMWKSEP